MAIDPNGAEWLEIERLIKEQIGRHDRILRQPGLPVVETENARGAIQFGEALLKTVKPSKIGFAALDPD